LLYPLYSFAETVVIPQETQNNTERNSRRVKQNDNADRPHKPNSDDSARPSNNSRPSTSVNIPVSRPANVSRPNVKPDTNHRQNRPSTNRPSNNHRPSTSTRPNNYYNHHYVNPTRDHSRIYYVSRRTYTPRYSTVIVYDRPSTVYSTVSNEDTSVEVATTSNIDYNKTFGIGFIGVVEVNSPIGNLDSHSSGGFGFYIKYRPARYFSIEFANDYLFGTLKYTDNYMLGYTKVPIALGVRIHFLDYGNVDTYAALAASLSVISYHDDYNYRQNTYISGKEYQYGGQFGIGFGYITDIFEIGFDVRYIIESIPDYIPYYISDDAKVIHGGLFTLSIGLAL
jgi:hypothetical protein